MKIGIIGCGGRMGRMLVAEVLATDGADLAGGTEQPGNEVIGQDVAVLAGQEAAGITIGDDAPALFEAADVVIDFTVPAATVAHAGLAAEAAAPGAVVMRLSLGFGVGGGARQRDPSAALFLVLEPTR